MDRYEIPARPEEIASAICWVTSFAVRVGFAPQAVRGIELAIEEALVNICSYAYDGRSGSIVVECANYGTSGLRVQISDRGKPFDVVASPAPDLCDDLARRPIGGLGIHLMRAFADVARYRRCGDANVLILLFRRRS